jgi:hypothetical protein
VKDVGKVGRSGEAGSKGTKSIETLMDLEEEVPRLAHDVRCLKYEIAKLKKGSVGRKPGAGADLASVDRDVPVTEDWSTVVEELKRDMEDLRAQISLARSGGGISQVFVDLPQTAAVQLVFRAQYAGDDTA